MFSVPQRATRRVSTSKDTRRPRVVGGFSRASLSARVGCSRAFAAPRERMYLVTLARLSHSGWRVELPAGAGSTILVPGIRSRRRVSGGGGLGVCPVLFVGGRNERSQAAAARSRSQAAAKMSWNGHAEAKANLTRRALTVTRPPSFY